jgi:hypothetical protein
MGLKRKLIRQETYQGRVLEAVYMGPDLLAFVNGVELASFYIDTEAALAAGRRYADEEEKAKAKRAASEGVRR